MQQLNPLAARARDLARAIGAAADRVDGIAEDLELVSDLDEVAAIAVAVNRRVERHVETLHGAAAQLLDLASVLACDPAIAPDLDAEEADDAH